MNDILIGASIPVGIFLFFYVVAVINSKANSPTIEYHRCPRCTGQAAVKIMGSVDQIYQMWCDCGYTECGLTEEL